MQQYETQTWKTFDVESVGNRYRERTESKQSHTLHIQACSSYKVGTCPYQIMEDSF